MCGGESHVKHGMHGLMVSGLVHGNSTDVMESYDEQFNVEFI